jgi:hypothetical protein
MNPWEPKANNIDTATNSTNFSCEAGREAGRACGETGEGSCVEREDQYEGEEGGGGEGVGGEEVEEVLVLLSLLFAE